MGQTAIGLRLPVVGVTLDWGWVINRDLVVISWWMLFNLALSVFNLVLIDRKFGIWNIIRRKNNG